MFIRKKKASLLYASSAPSRWLRAAAASLDEKLALVCAKQWQSVPTLAVVPVTVRADLRAKAATRR